MFVVPAAGLFVPPFVALITITKALSGYTFGVRSSASVRVFLGHRFASFPGRHMYAAVATNAISCLCVGWVKNIDSDLNETKTAVLW